MTIPPLTFSVDSLGQFQARHRTLGTQIEIERRYAQELGGPEEQAPENLRVLAAIKAQLGVLLADVPKGFSLEEALLADVYKVYAALREAEDRFQENMEQGRQGARQGVQPHS